MLKVLGFADDLTGALEAGAKFAGRGMRTVVTAAGENCPGYEAVVVDTETRHLSRAEAEAVLTALAGGEAEVIYKKTDSTLRGHIGAELRAMAGVYGAGVAYIPAYPAMGRTVRRGQLHVNGVPVHRTAFGQGRFESGGEQFDRRRAGERVRVYRIRGRNGRGRGGGGGAWFGRGRAPYCGRTGFGGAGDRGEVWRGEADDWGMASDSAMPIGEWEPA